MGRLTRAFDEQDSPHSGVGRIADLAAAHHGVVTYAQLIELGLTKDVASRLVRARHLHRLHRGVYAVGHDAVSPRGRDLAAVLSCGPEAVASHRLAGQLWGFVRSAAARREVTAPRSRAKREGVLVHRSRGLDPDDLALIDAVPVTTVARTLVDLGDVLTEKRLADAVHEAEVLRLFDLTKVRDAQQRVPGRRGCQRLERVLAAYEERPMTRTEAERRFLALIQSHSLPQPRANQLLHGYEVDFHWPHKDLVVEIDGAAAHRTRRAFENDRRRDRRLAKEGVRVIRVTWSQLAEGAADIAALLRR